jgi:flagellar hook assembly protein FlgD
VANFTIGLTIKAENNYWNGKAPLCYPKTSKISGSVDYIPALCSDPSTVACIAIYNVRGQRVTTLVDSHNIQGLHRVTWNGTNTKGNSVTTGVYFVQMKAAGFVNTKKLLLLK